MAQYGGMFTKVGTRAVSSRWLLAVALLAPACAQPRPYDPYALDGGTDGQPTSDDGLGSGQDGGDTQEPLPPAVKPGDVVWQATPGFAVEALGRDPEGNVVVAGRSRTPSLLGEIALAKYSATGTLLWQRSYGGAGEQGAGALAVASDGTIVITGGFQGDTSFGDVTRSAAGGTDVFVAAYNPEGRLKSVYTFGGAGIEEGMAVTIDAASGDWIVTGHGIGEFMAGATKVTGPFVLRMQPTGTVAWAHGAGRNLVVMPPDGGSVYVAGSSVKDQVTRHKPTTGEMDWTVQIGKDIHPSAGLIDSAGRLLLTGGFYTELGARIPPHLSFGKRDAFLIALNPTDGKALWNKVLFGSQGEDSGRAMCAGSAGNLFIGGRYFGTSALALGDPDTVEHAFVGRFTAEGEAVWRRLYKEGTSTAAILCGAAGGIVAGGDGWLMMVLP
jgi:hypothetical protein